MPQKPDNYGTWWRTHSKGAPWYTQIFAERQIIHDAFLTWVTNVQAADGQPFTSVLEVGCGCAVVYPSVFTGVRYTGFDFSQKEIDWCWLNCARPGHGYLQGDFIVEAERPAEKSDLVFSHAVIDHVYDIDAFVAALVKQSQRWVYLTSYRGWFPAIADHVYAWDEWTTCYYNSISATKLLAQLRQLGCTHLQVKPMDTGKAAIPQETVVIAKVPA